MSSTIAPSAPSGSGGHLFYGDLGPEARLAFGHWARSVYVLVEHLEHCPFGCTAERQRCPAGIEAVDDEQAEWQSWRDTQDPACNGRCDPPLYSADCPRHGAGAMRAALQADGGS